MSELAREAEIENARIFEPLPDRPKGFVPPKDARHPKPGTVLLHRTNLAAAQNIHLGALWISNNRSVLLGHETAAAYGDGIYAAPKIDQLGYGEFSVRFELAPDAIEGVDYLNTGKNGIHVLKTRQAIARNPDGSFKIERIGMTRIIDEFFRELKALGPPRPGEGHDAYETAAHAYSLIRGLGSVISVEGGTADAEKLRELLKISRTWDVGHFGRLASHELLRLMRDRPGMRASLDRNPTFERIYREAIQGHPALFPWDLSRPDDLRTVRALPNLHSLMMEPAEEENHLSFADLLFTNQFISMTS